MRLFSSQTQSTHPLIGLKWMVMVFLCFSQPRPIQAEEPIRQSFCVATELKIPNAFTPNGDGNNDRLCLQGWANCVKQFSISVFNRWGELVFQSNDAAFCWDGVYKGNTLQEGEYLYSIKSVLTNGDLLNRTGTITILK